MSYSNRARRELNSVSGRETIQYLLEINHSDLIDPLRVTGYDQDISHGGNIYRAIGLRLTVPDDISQGMPRARVEIDNVGRDLMEWLELSNGGAGTSVTLRAVLPSTPGVVEMEVQGLTLQSISATQTSVSADLTFEDLLGRPAVALRHTPHKTPGIF